MICEHSDTIAPPRLSQSRLYACSLRALGRELQDLPLGGLGQAHVVLRRMAGLGKVGLIPGGVQWASSGTPADRLRALAQIPRLVRARGVFALLCNAATPQDEDALRRQGHLPLITGGYDAEWDLSKPATLRRAGLLGKWRNRLVRAQAGAIKVQESRFSPRRHAWLLHAETQQRHARNYRALPLSFTRAVSEIAPEQVRLFTASHRGECLGAMMFLLHGEAATYHIGHITQGGRAMSAHNLLLWRASEWLADVGIRRLDLGSVETVQAAGLARFKLGTGAVPIQRGASCLYLRGTAPVGRCVDWITRKAVRAVAGQSDLSCR